MPTRPLKLMSFFDPEFADPECLTAGSVPWLLARYRQVLFPDWLFLGWSGVGERGRDAWPAEVLMPRLVLQWCGEGMSGRAAHGEAKHNTEWRAATGCVPSVGCGAG